MCVHRKAWNRIILELATKDIFFGVQTAKWPGCSRFAVRIIPFLGTNMDWQRRIEEALSEPMPGDDVVQLSRDYERAQNELAEAMEGWEKAVAYAEGIGAAV